MFSSVEREEEAVSCDGLGLRLLAFSDLDSKSVPHKHACAHMQAHTRSEASAEGDNQTDGPRAQRYSPMCCRPGEQLLKEDPVFSFCLSPVVYVCESLIQAVPPMNTSSQSLHETSHYLHLFFPLSSHLRPLSPAFWDRHMQWYIFYNMKWCYC